jgi:hypothetical protein
VKLPLVSSKEEREVSFNINALSLRTPSASTVAARHRVTVSKGTSVQELLEIAAREAGFESQNCCLSELWNKMIHKFFESAKNETVDNISANDVLLLHEMEDLPAFVKSGELAASSLYGRSSASSDAQATDAQEDPDVCGVVLHFRQARAPSYVGGITSKEIVGLPELFCVRRGSTANELLDAVRTQLQRRFSLADGWKLYKLNDRWTVNDGGTIVEPPVDSDPGLPLDLKAREWLVVEWEDGECPASIASALQEISDNSKGSSGRRSERAEMPLERCFEMFTDTEQLSSEDSWFCDRCKKHVQAYKRLQFQVMPQVLILQLKRFSYTHRSRERIDTPVSFPLEGLDLMPHAVAGSASQEDPAASLYDLAAISKHIGTQGYGHYVAYARSSTDGTWYYFDDSNVRSVTPEEVLADKVGAYVLFYIRRDSRPSGWGLPAS